MDNLYHELQTLLEDFSRDRTHVADNTDLLMGYADDFYDMLTRIKDKLDSFLHE